MQRRFKVQWTFCTLTSNPMCVGVRGFFSWRSTLWIPPMAPTPHWSGICLLPCDSSCWQVKKMERWTFAQLRRRSRHQQRRSPLQPVTGKWTRLWQPAMCSSLISVASSRASIRRLAPKFFYCQMIPTTKRDWMPIAAGWLKGRLRGSEMN
ncbi:unnamed protein product [Durusdinium trenchii]|uniref:Secreted protein n=1 Tax=Durusdinium trenchii TaxID=1381693 RepID=A0ABP0NCB3_9DINO